MKQKILFCRHCGNIAALIRDQGTAVSCCGEKMQELDPGMPEASAEKHIPVYQVEGNVVHVSVGAAEHPMTGDHYIEWVCLETEQGVQFAHLDPGDHPMAKFAICSGDSVQAAYAFCNRHKLWRK